MENQIFFNATLHPSVRWKTHAM